MIYVIHAHGLLPPGLTVAQTRWNFFFIFNATGFGVIHLIKSRAKNMTNLRSLYILNSISHPAEPVFLRGKKEAVHSLYMTIFRQLKKIFIVII